MKVTCPGCGAQLSVPDSAIGRTVACPNCRSPVKIEERLELAPEPPPPSAGPPVDPMKPRTPVPYVAPGACPTCGFPVARGAEICTRCGTDLRTGRRDEKFVGYRPSIFRVIFSRTGWILTAAVTAAIAIGLWLAVKHFMSWGKTVMEGESPKPDASAAEARAHRVAGLSGPAAPPAPQASPETPPSPPAGPAKSAPAAAPGRPAETSPRPVPAPAPAGPVASDPTSRFEEAFALLADPVPATQVEGLKKLLAIGQPAVELLGRRYSESQDYAVRAACVRGLARFRTPEAASLLTGAFGDPDVRIRDAAVAGISAIGRTAADAVGKALGSEKALARAAAARAAGELSLREHAQTVAKLMLSDRETEVRFEAARAFRGALGGPDVFGPLVTATGDESIDVAAAAAESLSMHSDSIDVLVKSLGSFGPERSAFAAVPVLAARRADAAETLAERLFAEKPPAKVLELCKRILALPEVAARKEAISEASEAARKAPQISAAVGLCLLDPDDRIRRAALGYVMSLAEIEFPLPVAIALGSQDAEFAFACARACAGRSDAPLLSVLRRAAKGVHPQRRVLAAGALAARGESAGAETLRLAALGTPALPVPLGAWAAYQYSLVGEDEPVKALLAQMPAGRDVRERVFVAAAAARRGEPESIKRLRAVAADRAAGEARAEAVRILGEIKDADSVGAIRALVREQDPALVTAAAKALAACAHAEALPDLVKRCPDLPEDRAQEVRSAILSFGTKAEEAILAAMDDPDIRVRAAALSLAEGLGKKASRKVVEKTVFVMRDRKLEHATRDAAVRALIAMTGVRPGEDWTWKQWAKALNVKLEDEVSAVPMAPMDWGWLTMEVPAAWRRAGTSAGDQFAPGSPLVNFTATRDPEKPGTSSPPAGRRFQSAQALQRERINDLTTALVTITDARTGKIVEKRERREGITATSLGAYNSGLATVAPARVEDKNTGRTTYWLFVVASGRQCSWYGEVAMSVDTSEYADYQHLFETRMRGSLKVHQDKIQ